MRMRAGAFAPVVSFRTHPNIFPHQASDCVRQFDNHYISSTILRVIKTLFPIRQGTPRSPWRRRRLGGARRSAMLQVTRPSSTNYCPPIPPCQTLSPLRRSHKDRQTVSHRCSFFANVRRHFDSAAGTTGIVFFFFRHNSIPSACTVY